MCVGGGGGGPFFLTIHRLPILLNVIIKEHMLNLSH